MGAGGGGHLAATWGNYKGSRRGWTEKARLDTGGYFLLWWSLMKWARAEYLKGVSDA